MEIAVEAEIETGSAHDAVARLQALTLEYPLRERFWLSLIRGLCLVGRRPEAIGAYDRCRSLLADHGLDPGVDFEGLVVR